MTKLIRTFHPVGHGAFYTEKHVLEDQTINIVYDCGSKTLEKHLPSIINNTFKKGEEIEFLFISHFDADHVNGIEYLKTYCKIKKVVIPLIEDKDAVLIIKAINTSKIGSNKLDTLIDSPEEYFPGSEIIKVRGVNEENSNNRDSGNGRTIPSGHKIILLENKWCFIPFNYNYTERVNLFKDKIKEKKLIFNKLDNIDYIQISQKAIKSIYKEIKGKANGNSLVVFSGGDYAVPATHYFSTDKKIVLEYDRCSYISCIYLGDSSANKSDFYSQLKERLDKLTESIGIIQIAHHGAEGNFSPDILKLGTNPWAIISCGSTDKHHPSVNVVKQIQENGSIPFMVTEKPTTEVEQTGFY
ncbi:MBL fold metallo-hydrolase [Bacteroides hominis]|uniref:MBL fold metallo-hydrolase n=1 Tax=Bacteroides hominis TaxID=2763023 RepID=UPI002949FB92|nr:MBL fold metallo-hydrolase [Bacteroides hominis (ex Liu et al. 2022)]MDV6173059.1 MBL fold metallo-hydrolase [Bacteroides hominis (ex Liu et al. 2022)]